MNAKICILVVDDDQLLRQGMARILRSDGYAVIEASTGDEALRLVRARRPEIVLLDRVLPDIDGSLLCTRIKRDPDIRHSYIFLLSGVKMLPRDHQDGIESGADEYLTKPIDRHTLTMRVKAAARFKMAEKHLRQSEELYRTLFESLQDVFYRVDLDGQMLLMSPSVIQLLGYTADEAVRLNLVQDLLVRAEHWDEMLARLRETGWTLEFEVRLRRCDGSEVWASATSQWFTDSAGTILGVEGMFRDITERKRAEEELRKAHDELEQRVRERTEELQQAKDVAENALKAAENANQVKNRFLSNMSHELRTPLNVILGYAQILDDAANLTDQQQRWFQIIQRSGEHLLTLINDLLDFSRLDAGQLTLRMHDMYLPAFLNQLVDMFRIVAQQKGLRFEERRDPALPTVIQADEKRVRQILTNLLSNAVKFTEHGTISFRVFELQAFDESERAPTSKLRFEVEDTGVGIAADRLEHVNAPFQMSPHYQYYSDGIGVGLAMAYRLTALMGSQLHVRSIPGQGTRFSFDLPVASRLASAPAGSPAAASFAGSAAAESGPAASAPHERQSPAIRPTVLIVDDEPTNRELLRDLLAQCQVNFLEAQDGQECLKIVQAALPDLILLDLRMPVMDGFEAARQIRALPAPYCAIPILAISASSSPDVQTQSLEAGCNEFLEKPISISALRTLVDRYIRRFTVRKNGAPDKASGPDDQEPIRQTPAAFLPPDMLQQLLALAERGNVKKLLAELDAIALLTAADAQPFIKIMRRLAENFQVDEILDMLKNEQH